MPAGDGATHVRSDPECSRCGTRLEGTLRVKLDEWNAIACRACAEGESWPPRCCVYTLPRADEEVRA